MIARRRTAITVLFMLTAAGCADLRDRSECLANVMCSARMQEPRVIQTADGTVIRRDNSLIVRPSEGAAIVLTDTPNSCETGDAGRCQGFALMARISGAHAFVVQRFFNEGSDFLLIDDRSGRETTLHAMPTFSPDNQRFLVAPFDDESDDDPNNLEIWRRQNDGAVMEWAHPFKQSFVEDPALPALYESRVLRWDPDRVTLEFSIEGRPDRHWTGTLTRLSDGWHLAANAPAGIFGLNPK